MAAKPAPEQELSPAELRRELAEIPPEISVLSRRIYFLVEQLRSCQTKVEGDLIIDWLDDVKQKRFERECALRERESLYEELMRKRKRQRRTANKKKGREADQAAPKA